MLSLQHAPVLAKPVRGVIWIYAGLAIVMERLDPGQAQQIWLADWEGSILLKKSVDFEFETMESGQTDFGILIVCCPWSRINIAQRPLKILSTASIRFCRPPMSVASPLSFRKLP